MMNDEKMVSIIAPVFKIDPKQLCNSINSMLDQDYNNYEIILVDDGSPDQCGDICDTFGEKHNNIHVIHTSNKGVSHARNIGIETAKGEFIIFVDADDILFSNAISKFMEIEKKCNADLVMSNYQVGNIEKNITGQLKKFTKKTDLQFIQSSFLSGNNIEKMQYTGAPWAKLYKKSIIIDNNCFYDESLPRSQDNEFNFRFMQFVQQCVYVDECLYKYTVNSDSAMRKFWKNAVKNADEFIDKIDKDINEQNNPDIYLLAFYQVCFSKLEDIMYTNIFHKDNDLTRRERKSLLKKVSEKQVYSSAIKQISIKQISYRKFLLFTLKHKMYDATYFLVTIRAYIKETR